MELRSYESNISIESNDGELMIEGLVNGTETWSHVLGNQKKFREKISKGTFLRALKKSDRFDFLSEHDSNLLLATTENGSLELWEDEIGLQMRANIVPTSYGKDIYTLIKNKVINHMSFGFRVVNDTWKKGADGIFERTVNEIELLEVSAVRNPAYPFSAIAARNIDLIEDVEIPDLNEDEVKEERAFTEEDVEAIAAAIFAKINAKEETVEQVKDEENAIESEANPEIKSETVEVEETTETETKENIETSIEEATEKPVEEAVEVDNKQKLDIKALIAMKDEVQKFR